MTLEAVNPPAASARLLVWQRSTVALMLVGYAGYYLCRSDLSVSTPLIIAEFKSRGIDKAAIGAIASYGTLGYAMGKFISGSVADFFGGRRMFLLGMGGAVLCTLLFGTGGLPFFTLAWVLNRFIQSTGWVGMVKLTSRWFSYSSYGAVMGVISLSFLFGDFLSRLFLAQLIHNGLGWRQIFVVSGAVLFVIFLINLAFLKESPARVGEIEPEANPGNVFGEDGQQERPASMRDLLAPLLTNLTFWTVCALSFGFTVARETFGTWTPLYLTEVAHMAPDRAATASSLFPLFGGISVLLCGFLSDRLGRTGRARIIFFGLTLSLPGMLALGFVNFHGNSGLPIFLIAALAFVLIGPYSFLAGAISLDFGGKRGSATAAGWIDGIGYIGGIFAGSGVGEIAQRSGWGSAFQFLTIVILLSCAAAALYWRRQMAPLAAS